MSKDPVPDWFGKGEVEAQPRATSTTRASGCGAPIAILGLAALSGGIFMVMRVSSQGVVDTTAPSARPIPPAVVAPPPAVEPVAPVVPVAPAPPEPEGVATPPPSEDDPTLSSASVREVMDKNRARFRSCFENALSYAPDAEGSVRLTMKIAATGRMESVSTTESGKLPPQVAVCISAIARTLRFPESGGSTTVNYPFKFSAQ